MTVVRNNPLARTRIGAVPYLNAIPLIYGLEDRIQFFHPAKLSEEFDQGRIDVGLLPIVEYFKQDTRLLVPRIAIGSKGAVKSVKLFLHKPLKDLRRVGVDRRSRTSAMLLKTLLELRYKLRPQYVEMDPEKPWTAQEYDGVLVIGDQALRMETNAQGMDLSEEWVKWTGLPFVFAAWQVRQGFSDSTTVQRLEEAAAQGISKIEHLVSLVPDFDPDFVKKYLSECLCYEFGEDQQHAIELFARFLTQLRLPIRERKIEFYDRQDLGKGLIRLTP